MKKTHILLVIDGPHIDLEAFSDELLTTADLGILCLSPRPAEEDFEIRLKKRFPNLLNIELHQARRLVSFDHIQQVALNKIERIGEEMALGNSPLKSVKIQGLNRWWSSPIVEATFLKWSFLRNLYGLTAIYEVFQQKKYDLILTNANDRDFLKDLSVLAQSHQAKSKHLSFVEPVLKLALRAILKWAFNLFSHLSLKMAQTLLRPRGSWRKAIRENLFYCFYPDQTLIRNGRPYAKIYGELPLALEKEGLGRSSYLVHFGARQILRFKKFHQDLLLFWKSEQVPMMSTHEALSFLDILKIYLNPKGLLLYWQARRHPDYKNSFYFGPINLFHTLDKLLQKSLFGQECREEIFHFKAVQNILDQSSSKDIQKIFTFVEFHSWEEAIVQAVRSSSHKVLSIGIQQSAPDPTLLSFYFTEGMFRDHTNRYAMPDLVLCAGENYRDLLNSYNISPSVAKAIGHLTATYYDQSWTEQKKLENRKQFNFPTNKKICFLPCSLESDLVEACFLLLKDAIPQNPDIHFIVKPHPNTPIQGLIEKYQLMRFSNFQITEVLIPHFLPVCDYCISTCTSVSLEALILNIPQIHLDVGLLPFNGSLHFEKNLIHDVSNADQLKKFLQRPEDYKIDPACIERFIKSDRAPLRTALDEIRSLVTNYPNS